MVFRGAWKTNSPEWCYKGLRINAHFKSLEGGTWQDIVLNLRDSAAEDQKLPDNISPDTSTPTNSSCNHKVVILLVLPRLEQLTKSHLQRLWRCGLALQVTWLSCPKKKIPSITCFHWCQSFLLWFPLLGSQQSLPLVVSLAIQRDTSPEFTPVRIPQKPFSSVCDFMVWFALCQGVGVCPKTKDVQTNPSLLIWPMYLICMHPHGRQTLKKKKWGPPFLPTGVPVNGVLRGLVSHAWTEWGAAWMEQRPGRGCWCRLIVSGQIPF